MNEQSAGRLPWRRIAAEGSAIVVSILLAFAIQAWWERRNLAEAYQMQVGSTLAELQEAQTTLDSWSKQRRRTESNVTRLAARLDSLPVGSPILVADTVVASLVSYVVVELPTAQMDALLSFDYPALAGSPLRGDLMAVLAMIDDQHDDEVILREFILREMGPYLRENFDVAAAQRAWFDWLVMGKAPTGQTELAATQQLRNLIAWRQRDIYLLLSQDDALAEALARVRDEVRATLD